MQTVTSPAESEQTSTFRPPLKPVVFALGGLVVLMVVGLAALRAVRPNVLPNITLAGTDVGGMTRDELRAAVDDIATQRSGDMVTVELEAARRSATNATVGYALDQEATVDEVWRRGRQLNPFRAVSDHIRVSFGDLDLRPVDDTDEEAVQRWARGVVEALRVDPVEGNARFVGTRVQRRDPEPGRRPTTGSLVSGARAAFADPGPDTLDVETETVPPRTTAADVDRLVGTARQLISAPVELTRGDASLTLDAETLASLYHVERSSSDDAVRLRWVIGPGQLREVFTDDVRARFEVEPRDATVVLTDGGPRVKDARRGFGVNLEEVRAQIDDLARSGDGADREAVIAGDRIAPDRTTKEVKDLRITQRVSSFTTEHACCESRVTNIHRFADLMDGALIEPDETFSLNEYVGPRTTEKGFVAGGAIQQGEYVDEVGGGVSQFATTFFNAAYFGGYEILEHKPHSYYISRYPVGRESTINYPTVDVVIRNDSPYGLLVDTSYTDTSITVTFWGREWVEVDSTTGEPHNYTNPTTEIRRNPDLPKGTERVIQSGSQGFDVLVTRRLHYDAGGSETEEYFTRYLAEPRIIERGTAG